MLGAGIFLELLAFAVLPLIAVAQGFPFEPALAFGGAFLALCLGVLAAVLLVAAVHARGWEQARVGYTALAVLFGAPLLLLFVAVLPPVHHAVP